MWGDLVEIKGEVGDEAEGGIASVSVVFGLALLKPLATIVFLEALQEVEEFGLKIGFLTGVGHSSILNS